MAGDTGSAHEVRPVEWLVPFIFILAGSWLMWHMPAFILDWGSNEDQSAFDRLSAQFMRNDATPNLPGLFGGFADIVDYIALALIPICGVLGIAQVRPAPLEQGGWTILDRFSVFVGRVTMVLIALLLSVMLYEVILRYVFERPTLWANELSLWIAGFVFLFAGLYAMQQRSHIRIFLFYDQLGRTGRRICDVISTAMIGVFAFGLVWGGYGEARDQFFRWETLGTAFDPPLPATLTPAVLIVICLVWIQSISNLIRDWNLDPVVHTAADDIDQQELAELKRKLGGDDNA